MTNVFNPLIGALFKASSLDNSFTLVIGSAHIKFGAVLGAVIQFLIVAVVVYFVFVYPINLAKNRAQRLRDKGQTQPDAPGHRARPAHRDPRPAPGAAGAALRRRPPRGLSRPAHADAPRQSAAP